MNNRNHDKLIIKLKLENKQLEEDMENLLMKNSVLLKMNQKLRRENSDLQQNKENFNHIKEELEMKIHSLEDDKDAMEDYQKLKLRDLTHQAEMKKYEEVLEELNIQVSSFSHENNKLKSLNFKLEEDVKEIREELVRAARREINFENEAEENRLNFNEIQKKLDRFHDTMEQLLGSNWDFDMLKGRLIELESNKRELISKEKLVEELKKRNIEEFEEQRKDIQEQRQEIEENKDNLKKMESLIDKKIEDYDNKMEEMKQQEKKLTQLQEKLKIGKPVDEIIKSMRISYSEKIEEKIDNSIRSKFSNHQLNFEENLKKEEVCRRKFIDKVTTFGLGGSNEFKSLAQKKVDEEENSDLEDLDNYVDDEELRELQSNDFEEIKQKLRQSRVSRRRNQDSDIFERGSASKPLFPDSSRLQPQSEDHDFQEITISGNYSDNFESYVQTEDVKLETNQFANPLQDLSSQRNEFKENKWNAKKNKSQLESLNNEVEGSRKTEFEDLSDFEGNPEKENRSKFEEVFESKLKQEMSEKRDSFKLEDEKEEEDEIELTEREGGNFENNFVSEKKSRNYEDDDLESDKKAVAFDIFEQSANDMKRQQFLEKMNKKRQHDSNRLEKIRTNSRNSLNRSKNRNITDSSEKKLTNEKKKPGMPKAKMIYYNSRKSSVRASRQHNRSRDLSSSHKRTPQKKKSFGTSSNKQIIKNAVKSVLFAGDSNKLNRLTINESLDNCKFQHFVILFKSIGRYDFWAMYAFNSEGEVEKIFGSSKPPKILKNQLVQEYFKYHSGSRNFKPIVGNRDFSIAVDAIVLKKSYKYR